MAESSSSTTTTAATKEVPLCSIVHFNDVYNIDKAPKFAHVLKEVKKDHAARFGDSSPLLVAFSGDFLSPSPMSTCTSGVHMLPVMNSFGIDVAALGNHDQDFGNAHCIDCFAQCNFPVLNANMFVGRIDDEEEEEEQVLMDALAQVASEPEQDKKLPLPLLGGAVPCRILTFEESKLKVGVVCASEDWTDLLPVPCEEGYTVLDAAATLQCLVTKLRPHVDLVIALTHSRLANDQRVCAQLREAAAGVDLLLGGHDHCHYAAVHDDTLLVKSGTDFEHLTLIDVYSASSCCCESESESELLSEPKISPLLEALTVSGPNATIFETKCHAETETETESKVKKSEKSEESGTTTRKLLRFAHRLLNVASKEVAVSADAEMSALFEELAGDFERKLRIPVGVVDVALDKRFSTVRSRECNAGNLIADVIRRAFKCDMVQICGGALRADLVYEAGRQWSMLDVMQLLPFEDPLVVLEMTGAGILDALENAVSGVPKLDGRFPHLSGARLVFDPALAPGSRVLKAWISRYDCEDGEDDVFDQVEAEQVYTVATREFMMKGGDGFTAFEQHCVSVLRDGECSFPMNFLMRNFFWAVQSVNDLIRLKRAGGRKESEVAAAGDDCDGDDVAGRVRAALELDAEVEARMQMLSLAPTPRRHSSVRFEELMPSALYESSSEGGTPGPPRESTPSTSSGAVVVEYDDRMDDMSIVGGASGTSGGICLNLS